MTDEVIISVEGLGKKYSIHHQRERYTALRDVLAEKAKRLVRLVSRPRDNGTTSQEDKGQVVSESVVSSPVVSSPRIEEFWALRDVNFSVRRGEVLGIIGRNGAGKTTLLKILSRITEPTEGRVRIRGRVASLLEVGTGFHPELTGRENIYLNGAILGMTRAEIKKKFDEIIAFAETEKFLDTPVKRYSSGMYVRLAFAVAAHLEPEILIVDEVLAVGDAEFQKKCLGKMESVSKKEGRTVLFVSHNMAAITSLTSSAILLDHGTLLFRGSSGETIERYVAGTRRISADTLRWGRGQHTRIVSADLLNDDGQNATEYRPGADLVVEIVVETDGQPGMSLELFLKDEMDRTLGLASIHQFHGRMLPTDPGTYSCRLRMCPCWLASGQYIVKAATSVVNSHWDHSVDDALRFDVAFSNPRRLSWDFKQSLGFGAIALPCTETPRFEAVQLPKQIAY